MTRKSLFGYIVDKIIDNISYSSFTNKFFSSFDFWKDPENYRNYLSTSRFLAEANNEFSLDPNMKSAWLKYIKHFLLNLEMRMLSFQDNLLGGSI